MPITTINAILPELESEVLVTIVFSVHRLRSHKEQDTEAKVCV